MRRLRLPPPLLHAFAGVLLLWASLPQAAHADTDVTLDGRVLRLSSGHEAAELPPWLHPQALVPERGGQDLLVLGAAHKPTPSLLMVLRYGRVSGAGEMRPLWGPVPLQVPVHARTGPALATFIDGPGPGGQALAVATGAAGEVWFIDDRTGAPLPLPPLGPTVDLAALTASPRVRRVQALLGRGALLYATDPDRVVLRLDMATGRGAACTTDAPPLGLALRGDEVVVLTERGAAAVPIACGEPGREAVSVPPRIDPSPALSATLPERGFDLSDRVLELPLPVSGTARSRRGVVVRLLGARDQTISLSPRGCRRTSLFVGAEGETPQPATEIVLTQARRRLALWAEQAAPGEECLVSLRAQRAEAGVATLLVRGRPEGSGATVLLFDRSFSMERSVRGAGPVMDGDGARRIDAGRRALMLLLSAVSLIAPAGSFAVLPFTDEVRAQDAAPPQGLLPGVDLANPDAPGGLRVAGFAGSQGDSLAPAGRTDLGRALQAAVPRLEAASGPRRLWVWSDGLLSGAGDPIAALRPGALASFGVHLFGVGAPGLDPFLPALLAHGSLAPEGLYAPPRGGLDLHRDGRGLGEAVLWALVREVWGGSALAGGAGEVAAGKDLAVPFEVPGPAGGGWVVVLATWERPEAALRLQVERPGTLPRCARVPGAQLCASPAYDGAYRALLSSTDANAAPEPARLRIFLSPLGSGDAGQVSLSVGLGRALHRSGDTVRVLARLTERGLPLRLAKVTARVISPAAGVGTTAARLGVVREAVVDLTAQNGDLLSGQAQVDLLDPAALFMTESRELPLLDDGDGSAGDNEALDGVYSGQFRAEVPGAYEVQVRAEYEGLAAPRGSIEERLGAQVIASLDPERTAAGVKVTPLPAADRLGVTVAPRDRAGHLLGPGQPGALSFLQGERVLGGRVLDRLDGSYYAELHGVASGVAVELRTPGGQGRILPAEGVQPGAGCSISGRGAKMGARQANGPDGFWGVILLFLLLGSPWASSWLARKEAPRAWREKKLAKNLPRAAAGGTRRYDPCLPSTTEQGNAHPDRAQAREHPPRAGRLSRERERDRGRPGGPVERAPLVQGGGRHHGGGGVLPGHRRPAAGARADGAGGRDVPPLAGGVPAGHALPPGLS
jgi:hypothetical protein